MGFTGFPADGMTFYDELIADNTKAFWTANKARYEASVLAPITALTEDLAAEFGEARIFRPYRDVRFSTDKSPYKDRQGAVVGLGNGMARYVQVGADGVTSGGGFRHSDTAQITRLRAAIDDDATGPELAALLDGLRSRSFEIGGDQVPTRPRGVPADHPRLELMRHKSLIVWRDHGRAGWLSTPAAADRIRDDWRAIGPLLNWLGDHVGPGPEMERRPRRR